MGERGQFKLIHSDGVLYLYTHWKGYKLEKILQQTLKERERWDDEEYFTRLLFCKMIGKEDFNDSTGYGIGLNEHGDLNYPLITVDFEHQFITREHIVYTFEEFILREIEE